ncbi:MAG: hypothetical protein MZU97_19270 [Bacillus subtilis]|nr:hypothetical protein [Bacillus subtilis]
MKLDVRGKSGFEITEAIRSYVEKRLEESRKESSPKSWRRSSCVCSYWRDLDPSRNHHPDQILHHPRRGRRQRPVRGRSTSPSTNSKRKSARTSTK